MKKIINVIQLIGYTIRVLNGKKNVFMTKMKGKYNDKSSS